MATFRYERLSDICCVRGRMDHQEQKCDEVVRLKKEGKKLCRGYGAWLRADGLTLNVSKEGKLDSGFMGESLSSFSGAESIFCNSLN